MSALWRMEKYLKARELLRQARSLVEQAKQAVPDESEEWSDADFAEWYLEKMLRHTERLASQEEDAQKQLHKAKIAEIDAQLAALAALLPEDRPRGFTRIRNHLEYERQVEEYYAGERPYHPGPYRGRDLDLDLDDDDA